MIIVYIVLVRELEVNFALGKSFSLEGRAIFYIYRWKDKLIDFDYKDC